MRLATALLVAGTSLALTACDNSTAPSTKRDATPAEATPPAVGREAAFEIARGTPQAFVEALYRVYQADEPRPEPGRDLLYQRTLNALIGEDFRRSNGKPWLTVDPVCDCTTGEIVLVSSTVTQTEPTKATADVVFTVDGTEKRQTLMLEREGSRWRVADVKAPDKPLLTESLFKAIE